MYRRKIDVIRVDNVWVRCGYGTNVCAIYKVLLDEDEGLMSVLQIKILRNNV